MLSQWRSLMDSPPLSESTTAPPEAQHLPPTRASRLSSVLALAGGAVGLVCLAALSAKVALHSGFLGARDGFRYIIAYIAMAAVIVAACMSLKDRLRARFVALVAAACTIVILLVLTLSGDVGAAAMVAITLVASFSLGSWAWQGLLGRPPPWPSALTLGAGLVALFTFLEGIGGLIGFWTLAAPILGVFITTVILGSMRRGPVTFDLKRTARNIARLTSPPGSAAVFCSPLSSSRMGGCLGGCAPRYNTTPST